MVRGCRSSQEVVRGCMRLNEVKGGCRRLPEALGYYEERTICCFLRSKLMVYVVGGCAIEARSVC